MARPYIHVYNLQSKNGRQPAAGTHQSKKFKPTNQKTLNPPIKKIINPVY